MTFRIWRLFISDIWNLYFSTFLCNFLHISAYFVKFLYSIIKICDFRMFSIFILYIPINIFAFVVFFITDIWNLQFRAYFVYFFFTQSSEIFYFRFFKGFPFTSSTFLIIFSHLVSFYNRYIKASFSWIFCAISLFHHQKCAIFEFFKFFHVLSLNF